MTNLIYSLTLLLLLKQTEIVPIIKNAAQPDLIVKASHFRLDAANKRIYFKAEISNIGDAPCTIHPGPGGGYGIQTYLSADNSIGNDVVSGGRVFDELFTFTLQPGESRLLDGEHSAGYSQLGSLSGYPYLVVELQSPNIESNRRNNKSIYKHGLPRKKGEGLEAPRPDNIPTQLAPKAIDLKLLISDVTSQLVTEPETGKQYKEYTYTATIKNIGNINAVIDLEKPISLQYWKTTSCTDTSGMTSMQRPENQHAAFVLEPQKNFSLPLRKVRQKPDAITPLLVQLVYDVSEKNKWNNFACLGN